MFKNCLNCGSEFNGKPKQKCCSRKCSNELMYGVNNVKCDFCGKEFRKSKSKTERSKRHYCSIKCKSEHQKTLLKGENNPNFKKANTDIGCSNCGKVVNILNCNLKNSDGSVKKNIYCSSECKAEHQKILLRGENNPKFRSVRCKCTQCDKEILRTPNYIKSKQNIFCSYKCWYDYMSINMCGKNSHRFRHDISNEEREISRRFEGYSFWRREVFKRDKFTCQVCGDRKGGNLNAHHLNSYNWDKDNRTNIDNGVTLCEKCHMYFHSNYGFGDNTKEQFEEFKQNMLIPR